MDLIHMTLNMPKSKRCVLSSFNDKGSILQPDLDDTNFYTSTGSKICVSKLVLKKFKKPFQNAVPDKTVINPIIMEKVQSESNSVYNLQSESLSLQEILQFDTNNKPLPLTTLSLKRKFDEIVNEEDTIESSPAASKFLKVSNSACHKGVNEDQWEHYTNFKPCTVKSYSDIPCLKCLVPNLLNNGKSLNVINSDSYLFNDHHHHTLVQSDTLPSVSFDKEISFSTYSDCLTLEETCKIEDHINLPSSTKNCGIKEVSPAVEGSSVSNQSYKIKTDLTNAEYNISKSTCPYPQLSHEKYALSPQKNPSFNNDFEIFSSQSLTTPEKFKIDHFNSSDVDFTTAAGEIINISNSALLKAHKLIQNVCDEKNQQNFPEKVTHDPNKRKLKKLHYFRNSDPFMKSTTLNMPIDTAHTSSESFKRLQVGEMTSKNSDADLPESIPETIGQENFDIPEDVCFSTAAGKSIAVSNAAMQAAQKLFQDVLKEEKIPTQSHGIFSNKIFKNPSAFKDIGCPSKKQVAEEIDVDMDNTLVEKLFEDTIFDEKDLETPSVSNNDKNTIATIEPNIDKNLPTRKPRKSLGGRRSMRFCSDKL